MDELGAITARVVVSATVPEVLDAGFDAFEVIRQMARACEDRVPELFAAFLVAAGAAVEGRNALNDAPSLPPARSSPMTSPIMSLAADVGHVADELAELAALLARRLPEAAAEANLADDRAACDRATRAAADIHQLLGRNTDETDIR
jgi:hypothetical protein